MDGGDRVDLGWSKMERAASEDRRRLVVRWLALRDSNPNRLDQNQLSCH